MFVKSKFPSGEKVFKFDDNEFKNLKKRAEKERMLISQLLRLYYREYKRYEVVY